MAITKLPGWQHYRAAVFASDVARHGCYTEQCMGAGVKQYSFVSNHTTNNNFVVPGADQVGAVFFKRSDWKLKAGQNLDTSQPHVDRLRPLEHAITRFKQLATRVDSTGVALT